MSTLAPLTSFTTFFGLEVAALPKSAMLRIFSPFSGTGAFSGLDALGYSLP
jgi:hypothetical protein